jgi:dihydroorotate dehydrogenase
MPDWSYRTLLRPLLFRLPEATARDLALGVVGRLGRSTPGRALIDFLGYMRAPSQLRTSRLGLAFPSPVGLGCGLDPDARAVGALARFGFGVVEIGPVTLRPLRGRGPVVRDDRRETILAPQPQDNPGLEVIAARLSRSRPAGVPILVRLAPEPGSRREEATEQCRTMIERLAPHADAFSLTGPSGPDWKHDALEAHFRALSRAAREARPARVLLACVPGRSEPDESERLARVALEAGVDGLLVDGAAGASMDGREVGRPAREAALRTLAHLRRRCGSDVTLVASGGVHEPEDALDLVEAGADLVQVDSGLVFSGPGLPKRINEALLFARGQEDAAPAPPVVEQSWPWALLMGLGMLFGSLLALVLALTRVVLPYDEQFVGLTRAQLHAINDRLLPFMSHDRATLAGTMVTVGVLYSGLSLFGIRRGLPWARVAVLASAVAGFASFFLFLGFGYFDPFHAFVTVVLLQFLLFGIHGRLGPERPMPPPMLREDRRWRLAQWGQLAFVLHSTALLAAGLVISFVGATEVFVPEDLEFMRTTRDALLGAGPHLLPLVAHDRASFGGMLVASGMTFLMASLWGFRRGTGWLWWTLLLGGIPGYAAAIGIHFAVGYRSPWHLAPAFAGLLLFIAAVALSHPYLCGKDAALEEAWRRRRSAPPDALTRIGARA